MGIKSLVLAGGLMAIFSAPFALAEPPDVNFYVWLRPDLGFDECMQQAASALHQIGVKDAQQNNISAGFGFVGGGLGDYYLWVICLTLKGTVITQVAGNDASMADNYRKQIDSNMGNGSGH